MGKNTFLQITILLSFQLISHLLWGQQALMVSTMPSNDINVMEGNAKIGESLTLWGMAIGGVPPYTYTLKVDGQTIPITDSVTEAGNYYNVTQN